MWTLDLGDGYGNSNGYIVVLPDGNVITRIAERLDKTQYVGDAVLGAPPAVSELEDCLAEPDARARFECLSFDAGSPATVCEEGSQ